MRHLLSIKYLKTKNFNSFAHKYVFIYIYRKFLQLPFVTLKYRFPHLPKLVLKSTN